MIYTKQKTLKREQEKQKTLKILRIKNMRKRRWHEGRILKTILSLQDTNLLQDCILKTMTQENNKHKATLTTRQQTQHHFCDS